MGLWPKDWKRQLTHSREAREAKQAFREAQLGSRAKERAKRFAKQAEQRVSRGVFRTYTKSIKRGKKFTRFRKRHERQVTMQPARQSRTSRAPSRDVSIGLRGGSMFNKGIW